MKSMCIHQNLTGLPKNSPKSINQAPYTICYTENMTNFPKGTTFDTTNIQKGQVIHLDFASYDVTSIRGFTSILTIVCTNTRIIWVFNNVSKISPVFIIRLILTTLLNKQHPCKRVIVEEDGDLSKSTYFIYLLVDDFSITKETTGGNVPWLNGDSKTHNSSIHAMVREDIIDINQHENKLCFEAVTSS